MPLEPTASDLPKSFSGTILNLPHIVEWRRKGYFCTHHVKRVGPHNFTHWSFAKEYSGKMCIPDSDYNEFYKTYSRLIRNGIPLYMTEKRSTVSRVFMDLDFAAYLPRLLNDDNIEALVSILIKTVVQFWCDLNPQIAKPNSKPHVAYPLSSSYFQCLLLHSTRKYPIDEFLSKCSPNSQTSQASQENSNPTNVTNASDINASNNTALIDPSMFARDPDLLKKYGAGVRVYFPNLFATDDQLDMMRRACIIAWERVIGKEASRFGFCSWNVILDSSVYEKNGLRMTGSRKIETCKKCKSTASKDTQANTALKHTQSSNSLNSSKSQMDDDNYVCDLCDGQNQVDVGRVYTIWKVYDVKVLDRPALITLARTQRSDSSSMSSSFSSSTSSSIDYAMNSLKTKLNLNEIHNYCAPKITLVPRNDRVLMYQKDIEQLIFDTRIRTIQKQTTEDIWNSVIYETNIGYSIDEIYPRKTKDTIVRMLSDGTVMEMADNDTARKICRDDAKHQIKIPPTDSRAITLLYLLRTLDAKYKNIDIKYMVYSVQYQSITIYVTGEGSRFCKNLNNNHNSNQIYFWVNKKGIFQKCFCRCPTEAGRSYGLCSKFKSQPHPLPEALKSLCFGENTLHQSHVDAMVYQQRPEGNFCNLPSFMRIGISNWKSSIDESEFDDAHINNGDVSTSTMNHRDVLASFVNTEQYNQLKPILDNIDQSKAGAGGVNDGGGSLTRFSELEYIPEGNSTHCINPKTGKAESIEAVMSSLKANQKQFKHLDMHPENERDLLKKKSTQVYDIDTLNLFDRTKRVLDLVELERDQIRYKRVQEQQNWGVETDAKTIKKSTDKRVRGQSPPTSSSSASRKRKLKKPQKNNFNDDNTDDDVEDDAVVPTKPKRAKTKR